MPSFSVLCELLCFWKGYFCPVFNINPEIFFKKFLFFAPFSQFYLPFAYFFFILHKVFAILFPIFRNFRRKKHHHLPKIKSLDYSPIYITYTIDTKPVVHYDLSCTMYIYLNSEEFKHALRLDGLYSLPCNRVSHKLNYYSYPITYKGVYLRRERDINCTLL